MFVKEESGTSLAKDNSQKDPGIREGTAGTTTKRIKIEQKSEQRKMAKHIVKNQMFTLRI